MRLILATILLITSSFAYGEKHPEWDDTYAKVASEKYSNHFRRILNQIKDDPAEQKLFLQHIPAEMERYRICSYYSIFVSSRQDPPELKESANWTAGLFAPYHYAVQGMVDGTFNASAYIKGAVSQSQQGAAHMTRTFSGTDEERAQFASTKSICDPFLVKLGQLHTSVEAEVFARLSAQQGDE